jgi:C4-dicarboxylate-specific signal transduction histidine kinase
VILHDGEVVLWANRAAAERFDVEAPEELLGTPLKGATARSRAPGETLSTTSVMLGGRPCLAYMWRRPAPQATSRLEDLGRLHHLALLSGGLVHDLNNPLASLTLGIGIMARRLDTMLLALPAGTAAPETRRAMDALHNCRATLAGLQEATDCMSSQLRAFASQVEPGNQEASGQASGVRKSVESAMKCVRGRVAGRATVELEAGDAARAGIAEGPLTRVIMNLVANAAEAFSRPHPHENRVKIRVRRAGSHVLLDVTDNGPGVSAEVRDRLFEPFVTTKGKGSGAGLGLAVSRRLVRHAGGELELVSSGESGTTFRCVLPVAEVSGLKAV